MHVVAVPGRTVRHPVTRRVIDARGIPHDPNDLTIARYIADGDLDLVETAPDEMAIDEPGIAGDIQE